MVGAARAYIFRIHITTAELLTAQLALEFFYTSRPGGPGVEATSGESCWRRALLPSLQQSLDPIITRSNIYRQKDVIFTFHDSSLFRWLGR